MKNNIVSNSILPKNGGSFRVFSLQSIVKKWRIAKKKVETKNGRNDLLVVSAVFRNGGISYHHLTKVGSKGAYHILSPAKKGDKGFTAPLPPEAFIKTESKHNPCIKKISAIHYLCIFQ